MIFIYNALITLALLVGWPLILLHAATSPKRRQSFLHRMGLRRLPVRGHGRRSGKSAAGRKPVWVHALSVGEVLSSLPLARKLAEGNPDRDIVFSAATASGFDIAQKSLQGAVSSVVYFPYDIRFAVRRVFDAVDPAYVVIVESDIWPNFLHEAGRRKVPAFLVNARLSDRSFAGYKRFSRITRPMFSSFTAICTQSEEDRRRFRALGIPEGRLLTTGNLKFDQENEPLGEDTQDRLRESLGIERDRKVFVAGSTHEGEEEILAQALGRLREKHPGLVMIVAPRNVERSVGIGEIFSRAGFRSALLGDFEGRGTAFVPDVIVIDRIGLLRKLYALAHVSFVGGSLVDLGGHNPLEPAAFAKPVLFGPFMSNFREISGLLRESRGAAVVSDARTLFRAAEPILSDSRVAAEMGGNAYEAFQVNMGAAERTLDAIRARLPRSKPSA